MVSQGRRFAGIPFGCVRRTAFHLKDVNIAETEPKGCTFLEKLDVDSGTWMTFSGKGFKEKSARMLYLLRKKP